MFVLLEKNYSNTYILLSDPSRNNNSTVNGKIKKVIWFQEFMQSLLTHWASRAAERLKPWLKSKLSGERSQHH